MREHFSFSTEGTKKPELPGVNVQIEDVLRAIPGGIAIYKVSDIFETVYFSEGVPELTGYTVEEYEELVKGDAINMTCPEDTMMVTEKVKEALLNNTVADFEFRKVHRDGHIVWVHVQAKQIGEEDGYPLLHCVFHNITELKETQHELNHLINSIPGGIAIYRIEDSQLKVSFFSDGVMALSGHTREEYEKMVEKDALNIIYEPDRERVFAAAKIALESGEVLDVSYRIRHKNGQLIWIHLNGRRMEPLAETTRFYAVFTGMSAETRLFQSIANETVDGIYVIGQSDYELLYVSESKNFFLKKYKGVGQKCYALLHGKSSPCEFCTLNSHEPDGEEHEMYIDGSDRFYSTRFRKTNWNGIPAYIKYVRDITEEVRTREEKNRLEQYFQTVVKKLPGGVAVIRYDNDGYMVPEFLSDGFAQMTGMTLDEVWELYSKDAMTGVHPDDKARVKEQMAACVAGGAGSCEIEYRLKRGDGSYLWIRNTLSLIQSEDGVRRVYAVYRDITNERKEKEQLREQYREMIFQHYSMPDPNALVIGHCNITQNRILEIIDHTDSSLLENFGTVREEFFTGLSGLVVDESERQKFLETYLNEPSLAAFKRNDTEVILKCFVQLPKEECGRYVKFKVNLVETPDTGDITGILTVTDITSQTISERILHKISVTGYDFVIDLDLVHDYYKIIACRDKVDNTMPESGCHSARVAEMVKSAIVPKDQETYETALNPEKMYKRLTEEGFYTLSFSVRDEKGNIRTKNMIVSPVDLRLGRVCLMRTDVTEMLAAERETKNALEEALAVAEEANRAKSDFLSTMSHDIRTPMNAIMGMTALAFNHLNDSERIEDCLKKISVSSKHLLSLINDILDMSKIEQSKITLNRMKTCLPEQIEQLSAIMGPQARTAGLQFHISSKEIYHEYFYGDTLRLNQILINILSNAIKFTPEGGTVAFVVEEVEPLNKEQYVRYRFTISDSGIGMSEDFLTHIFEPFARSSSTSRIEGTGLGLSISKGLVDLMGGTIAVESSTGYGTKFEIEMEFEGADSEDEAAQKEEGMDLPGLEKSELFAGRRFLVAEDNEINAEILCGLLKMYGAQSVVRTDGLQTVREFEESPQGTYDVVLMDIQMPHMNGYEATRAIRNMKRPDADTIPVVAMTANAFAEDVQEALSAGMTAHISKPIDVEVLQRTLWQVLK